MKKELHCKVVDMLLDQKFRNEAVAIITELVKLHPTAVVAAYEQIVKAESPYEYFVGRIWSADELAQLYSNYASVIQYMRNNKKVDAVRNLRTITGWSLKEAVGTVNYAQHLAEVHWMPEGTFVDNWRPEVIETAREIAAVIKKYFVS